MIKFPHQGNIFTLVYYDQCFYLVITTKLPDIVPQGKWSNFNLLLHFSDYHMATNAPEHLYQTQDGMTPRWKLGNLLLNFSFSNNSETQLRMRRLYLDQRSLSQLNKYIIIITEAFISSLLQQSCHFMVIWKETLPSLTHFSGHGLSSRGCQAFHDPSLANLFSLMVD